ncbi:hypothetical protein BDV3_006894 [Batrachochytrium dendrobatidis]
MPYIISVLGLFYLVQKTLGAFSGAARIYETNETIPVYFNKVFSNNGNMPFAYDELPFVCSPAELSRQLLNIDQILHGDRVVKSDIEVQGLIQKPCKLLCSKPVHQVDITTIRQMIQENYLVEWIIDDLPGATVKVDIGSAVSKKSYKPGFPLGSYNEKFDMYELNNHLVLNILYNEHSLGNVVIVGFEVYPASVRTFSGACQSDINPQSAVSFFLPENGHTNIEWSYSISWQLDTSVGWSNRWDRYLVIQQKSVTWNSVTNSLTLVFMLTALVAIVVLYTLSRDILQSNDIENPNCQKVSTDINKKNTVDYAIGWKALQNDVFRSVQNNGLLAALVGASIQFIIATILTAIVASFGLFGPAINGGFITGGLVFYISSGFLAGYSMSILYKSFRGVSWKRIAILTGCLIPATILTVVFLINLAVWWQKSSFAIPIGTFVVLIFVWVFVCLPLVWIGSRMGSLHKGYKFPTGCRQIPRQIPQQPWYLDPVGIILIAGVFPFAVVYFELSFVFDTVWQMHHIQHFFGYVSIIAILFCLTCIEISVIITYLTLGAEDHQWQWRAFATGASPTLYIFAYSVLYYIFKFSSDKIISGVMFCKFRHGLHFDFGMIV